MMPKEVGGGDIKGPSNMHGVESGAWMYPIILITNIAKKNCSKDWGLNSQKKNKKSWGTNFTKLKKWGPKIHFSQHFMNLLILDK